MNRTDLIEAIAQEQSQLSEYDVALAVKVMLERMSEALARGDRIEIRGFGSFCLKQHSARICRDLNTGESVAVPARLVPCFKPGKELTERVNALHDSCSNAGSGEQSEAPEETSAASLGARQGNSIRPL